MNGTIEVSKCCQADTEDITDELGDFMLLKCKTCGQECTTRSVCELCEGLGTIKEWVAVDEYVTTVCPCSVESVAEMRGEKLAESLRGN